MVTSAPEHLGLACTKKAVRIGAESARYRRFAIGQQHLENLKVIFIFFL
jgi:hypothetical protein